MNTPDQIPPKKQRRKYRIQGIVKLLSRIFLLLLILELGWLFLGNLLEKPVIARWETVVKGCWVEAVFLRNEKTFLAPIEGNLITMVEEGIKVPRGEVLARIESHPRIDDSEQEDYSSLQNKLLTCDMEEQSLKQDLERVQSEIINKRSKTGGSSIKSIRAGEISEDLSSLEKEKGQILRSIQNIRQRGQNLRNKLSEAGEEPVLITASEPGYLIYQLDGWEGKIRPENFSELSAGIFRQNFSLKPRPAKVNSGKPIGKIVNPFQQKIAVIVNTRLTGYPRRGDLWWIKTPEGTHPVRVIDFFPLNEERFLLALEDSELINYFLPNRRSRIFIIYKKVSGVCIPIHALLKKGPTTMVKVVKGDGFTEKEVTVKETDGAMVIVDGLEFGTTIISR